MKDIWKWFKVGYIIVLAAMFATTVLVVLSTFEPTTAASFYGKTANRLWEIMPVSPAFLVLAQGGVLALFVWAKGKRIPSGKGNGTRSTNPVPLGGNGLIDLPLSGGDEPGKGRPDEAGGKVSPPPPVKSEKPKTKSLSISLSDWVLIGLIAVVVGFGLLSGNPTTPSQIVRSGPIGQHTVADFLVNNAIVLLVLGVVLIAGLWYFKMTYEARSTARFRLPVNVGGKAMPVVIDIGLTFYKDLGKILNYLRLVLGRKGKKAQDILKDVQVIDAPGTEEAVWVIYVVSSIVGRGVAQGRFTLENILELEKIEGVIRSSLASETRLSAYGLKVETVVVRDITFPREVEEAQAKTSAARLEGQSWAEQVASYLESMAEPGGEVGPRVALGIGLAIPIISALGNIAETLVGGRKGDSQ